MLTGVDAQSPLLSVVAIVLTDRLDANFYTPLIQTLSLPKVGQCKTNRQKEPTLLKSSSGKVSQDR
jgi:hypothetical protein